MMMAENDFIYNRKSDNNYVKLFEDVHMLLFLLIETISRLEMTAMTISAYLAL